MFDLLPPVALNAFWISQGLILVAITTDIISWQNKKRERVLFWLVISSFLIACHFLLLEQFLAAGMVFISMLRCLVGIFSTDKRWMYVFMALVIGSGFILYSQLIDLISFLASLISCYAIFQVKDWNLRIWSMLATSMWIVFNILVFSPAAALMDTIFLLSNITGFYRFYIRKNKLDA